MAGPLQSPIQSITFWANEGGTAVFTTTFADETGTPFTPQTCLWSLTDQSGAVINGRHDVIVSTPGATVTIVIQGQDLAIEPQYDQLIRILTISGTYNSVNGTGLPFTWQYFFGLVQLAGWP